MTLEEKLAQLGSIGPKNILEGEEFSPAKAREKLEHGIGQISRIAGASGLEPEKAAWVANELQKFLLEETESSIPAMIYEECLSGYMGKRGTVYPQTIGLGSTWSAELIEKMGKEISKQIRAMGGHLGAPIADVIRDMRWGRVEECFGEDQYLVSELITAYVQGLQGDDLTDKQKAAIKALAAGLDIELPETNCYGDLREAVQEGLISMEVIDESVRRHLWAKMKLGLFQDPYVDPKTGLQVYGIIEE